MNVSKAIKKRQSVRAWSDKKVDIKLIKQVLEVAKYSPSAMNLQPWEVAIVSGDTKNKIAKQMQQYFLNNKQAKPDVNFSPGDNLNDLFLSRRKACGLAMYSSLNIQREDKQGQKNQWLANYDSFGAPIVLYFFLDKNLGDGALIDYGMFLQSIMLALVDVGLSSCPQGAIIEYPEIIKTNLGKYDDKKLVCAMAIGYKDKTHPINNYRTQRAELSEFVTTFE